MHPEIFYTSQSAITCLGECPRRYWFQNQYLGQGITLRAQSVPLIEGIAVHEAIKMMVKQYVKTKILDVEYGVRVARERYENDCYPGLSNTPTTEQVRIIKEQIALSEVLVRLWAMFEFSILKNYYRIVAVEFEIQYPIGQNIIFQSKPDLLLIHKSSNTLINYSLKTIKGIYANTENIYAISNQSITEPWITNWYLNKKYQGVDKPPIPTMSSGIRFCYLIKGERKEQTKGNKDYITNNPFLYAWRKIGQVEIEYAWSFWTNNPNNKSGYGRLGKGWEQFKTFEDDLGIHAWMEVLRQGVVDPDLHDGNETVFERHIHSQSEVYIPQHVAESRMRQIEATVADLVSKVDYIKKEGKEQEERLLDYYFPMNTQSCYFPSQCEYLPICPNGNRDYRREIAENPLSTEFGPLYQIRIPHHEPEEKWYKGKQGDGK